MKRILFFFCLATAMTACNSKKDYVGVFNDPNLYCDAVHELNKIVMGNNFFPIVASRNYLYASVAGYEVIAGGFPDKYNSLAGQLHGLTTVPKPEQGKEINYPLASLLAFCRLGESVTFPQGSMKYYVDSLKMLAKMHGMPEDMINNSVAYADTVSSAILEWSKHDNYAETRGAPDYSINDSPGRWVPTPPAYSPAVEPHWSTIRNLVIDSVTEFAPPPPYKFDMTNKKSPYYLEVKKIQDAVNNLTPEQTHIADFWDDNPFKLNVSGHLMFGTKKFSPGGHWMGVAGIAAIKSGADFPKTVYGFAITAIAEFDAFIESWNFKYVYNTLRPETAINKYIDPNWRPHLQTPPFPEYTCAHCTISGAVGEVLSSVYGDPFPYTDTTELEFGIANRSFNSFRDAAKETRISRFYGGIHYDYCTLLSYKMGTEIGKLIVDRLKMKKD